MLVDPRAFFVQDYTQLAYNLSVSDSMDVVFDKDESYLGGLKSFPRNTEIDAVLTRGANPMAALIPQPRGSSARAQAS